jgi:tetratricopeptide (TPR) repeat protein
VRACFVGSVALLVCTAGLAQSAENEQDKPAVAPTGEQISGYLEAGRNLLMKGLPAEAIRQYFDPVILKFSQANQDPDVQVYAAHSMQETLMYTAMAAATGKDKSGGKSKSIVVDGTWTDALEMKAYALAELGRIDEAKNVLLQAIALSPEYPTPWIELGSDYQTEKNWPAAMDAYQHGEDAADLLDDGALKTEKLTRALRGKAFVLTELGRLDESEALYKRCLSMNPDDGMARHELDYIAHLRENQAQKPADNSR